MPGASTCTGRGRDAFAPAAPTYSISTPERGERRRLTAIAAIVLALHVVAGMSFIQRDSGADRVATPPRAPVLIHLVMTTDAAPARAIAPAVKPAEPDRPVRRREAPPKRALSGARADARRDTVRPTAPARIESTSASMAPAVSTAPTSPATQAPPEERNPPESPPRAAETAPLFDAAYLHNRAPDYPPIALQRHWEGTVLLNVHVLANGTARDVTVLASSGHESLDAAALEAVADWRFVPAHYAGQAIDAWVHVPVVFKTA